MSTRMCPECGSPTDEWARNKICDLCGFEKEEYALNFTATGLVFSDAQTLRKTADKANWKVRKTISIVAACYTKCLTTVYPQDDVRVYLDATLDSCLKIKFQSLSIDAGQQRWRQLVAKKKL